MQLRFMFHTEISHYGSPEDCLVNIYPLRVKLYAQILLPQIVLRSQEHNCCLDRGSAYQVSESPLVA